MDEKIILKVEGMTCSSCAQGISRHLHKKGLKQVIVDYDGGKVALEKETSLTIPDIIDEINSLGYHAFLPGKEPEKGPTSRRETLLIISALFTVPLLLHMLIPFGLLHNSYVQFVLCVPVIVIGLMHFGRSAWGSIKVLQPNMDVLILTGALSAFIYSTLGMMMHGNKAEVHQYLFFESAAAIITFLLLGNLIEHRTLKKTVSAVNVLSALQPLTAKRISNPMSDDETTEEVSASSLRKNDLVLISTGDKIPADGLIYWGTASIDESSMTGEFLPADKKEDDKVLAGSIILKGSIKIIAEATGDSTVLSNVINIVKNATQQKPSIQRIGDKVSAWFVPLVLLIAVIVFSFSYFLFDVPAASALLRSIAVLVISCPCAMGLATPTAVSAGIGRAAGEGILVKSGRILEDMAQGEIIVFDKTGTLTSRDLTITDSVYFTDSDEVHYIIHQLENHSTHPIAKALLSLKPKTISAKIQFTRIEEEKGSGMIALDKEDNKYYIGRPDKNLSDTVKFQVIVRKNEMILAGFNLGETIRQGAIEMVAYFRNSGLRTVLLSGDRESACKKIAELTGIDEVYSEKLPSEKSEIIKNLKTNGKVIMVGDGINDSPSLALAHTGISFGSATQIAISTSDIVIMNEKNLQPLIKAHQLSKATLKTIKQNLFWALIYNVIAIPVAALGLLSPVISSFSMAFSDVIVIGNSLRLKIKNIFTGLNPTV